MATESNTDGMRIRQTRSTRIVIATLSLATICGLLLGTGRIDQISAAVLPGHGAQRGDCLRAIMGGLGLNNVLDEMVADGTLTEPQETAILDRVTETRAEHRRPCTGVMLVRDGAIGDAVTDLLGMDRGEIREAWLDGQSLTDMAAAQGIDRQTLVDTIADALGTKLDELVADEKITPERRGEIFTNAQPTMERAVDLHRGELRDQSEDAESDEEASPATTSSEALVA
jgi:hypothetical protein